METRPSTYLVDHLYPKWTSTCQVKPSTCKDHVLTNWIFSTQIGSSPHKVDHLLVDKLLYIPSKIDVFVITWPLV